MSLLCLFAAIHIAALAQSSDESGTLVAAGRSAAGVAISVDSAVSTSEGIIGERKGIHIDGSRKLIDVGPTGACAIDGYLGVRSAGNDLARDLRRWIVLNPDANVSAALPRMLEIAANSWDRAGYSIGHLPEERTVGAEITGLTCGDILPDGPGIIIGWTTVGNNGRAVVEPPERVYSGLYLAGVFGSSQSFIDFIQKNEFPPSRHLAPAELHSHQAAYAAIRKQFMNDSAAIASLNAAIVADNQMQQNARLNATTLRVPPSPLQQADLKVLFIALYKSVEHNIEGVAPPNNARLITACGRFATTVESTWPRCGHAHQQR